ncbi:MAG: cobalamin-dependent protein, partial [Elusimicrobiota bacterium]
FKPNAGMPQLINRRTVFPGTVEEFVAAGEMAYQQGISLLGGCCGTTPAFIKALAGALKGKKPMPRTTGAGPAAHRTWLSSRTKAFDVAHATEFIMIGERINPTNRKKFQEELGANNFATVRREAVAQEKAGAQVIDLNLGLPGADEKALMIKAVEEVQEVVAAPVCLDSSSSAVLEAGIRQCAGKPIINSVNGEEQRMDTLLPMAKRYGAMIIALTTDEKGIPATTQERLAIAERIMAKAHSYGIAESEIIFDFLTLAVSAMPGQTEETLAAIRASKQRWPRAKTVLGISNVSFGLPNRQALNSTFLKMAREAGLDMGIMNPREDWSIDDLFARKLLLGKDPNGERYIAKHGTVVRAAPVAVEKLSLDRQVSAAVIEGTREEIAGLVGLLIDANWEPLTISNQLILPALSEVGKKFAAKEFFLPQVMRSAETAQAAFAVLRPLLKKQSGWVAGKIVLATVKGDVHDIGKNIVGAVLESHGWDVVDLGKNIDAAQIVVRAGEEKADVIGLSALMTTTMPEMEAVVLARAAAGVTVKILIGGAPVTATYAEEIGADGYAPDAVTAARAAARLIGK